MHNWRQYPLPAGVKSIQIATTVSGYALVKNHFKRNHLMAARLGNTTQLLLQFSVVLESSFFCLFFCTVLVVLAINEAVGFLSWIFRGSTLNGHPHRLQAQVQVRWKSTGWAGLRVWPFSITASMQGQPLAVRLRRTQAKWSSHTHTHSYSCKCVQDSPVSVFSGSSQHTSQHKHIWRRLVEPEVVFITATDVVEINNSAQSNNMMSHQI